MVYGLNVIDQILCLIYSNFKIFPKLTDTSPKWRHLWYLYYVRSMLLRFDITSVCVFFSFLMYGLNVIDQILCLFCWNYKNFSKLTNTSPKWRHLWIFYLTLQINASKVCITSVCVFISSLVYGLNVIDQVLRLIYSEILRFSLNWRVTSPKWRHSLVFYITSGQCPKGLYYIRLCFFQFFVYGLNVIDQILCHIYSNFKIFAKLTGTSTKWRHLWIIYFTPDQCR